MCVTEWADLKITPQVVSMDTVTCNYSRVKLNKEEFVVLILKYREKQLQE